MLENGMTALNRACGSSTDHESEAASEESMNDITAMIGSVGFWWRPHPLPSSISLTSRVN